MNEADMVRNKYDVIRDMLRREKMYYTRQQSQLEGVLKEQNKERGLFINQSRIIIMDVL